MTYKLLPNERIDDLLAGGLRIIQNKTEFCFSLDAVLLAHFVTTRKKNKGLDLGTGTGVIPLLLSDKISYINALEINPITCDLAKRNVILNKLEHKIKVMHGDLCNIEEYYSHQSMDFVVSNPPYRQLHQGHLNIESGIAQARHEITANLNQVVRAASYVLKDRGRFAMVHLPERLGEIMVELERHNLAPKKMQLVQPKKNKSPNILLIEAVKSGQLGGLKVLPTLIVHEDDGGYTKPLLEYYYPDKLFGGKSK